jgi:glycerol-3-phosphate acyltransferase PlsY
MTAVIAIVALVGYLCGSIPSGVILTRWFAGLDVRQSGSGRTGSTNVMRVGGWKLGLATGLLDALKAGPAILLAQLLLPGNHWAGVIAGLAAVLGHIYSIFIGFKGGAGGAPAIGGAIALWPWTAAIVIPIGALVWYGVGYASVATLSFSVVIITIMVVRWYIQQGPSEYIAYGIGTLLICLWTLRPNLRRLLNGTEPLHGWRAKRLTRRRNDLSK